MNIHPEAEFLISCCRDPASDGWGAGIRQRASAVQSWDSLVRLSAQHGVASLVLPLLKELSEDGRIPNHAVSELRKFALYDTARSMRLRSALGEMLKALQDAGVRVIVLKGVALATLVYPYPNVRPSQDIDLLCSEEDYRKVRDSLVSLGYETDADPTLPTRRADHEGYFDRHFFNPDGLVHVELHVDSLKLGVKPRHSASIRLRARHIEIEDVPALALGPEDQVLTLSVHLHRHGFNRLIWFKDLDLLIRRYADELDWGMVTGEGKAEGAQASLWYTLRFLRKMFDTPIPENVMANLRPNPLIRWAFAKIWPESQVLNLRSRTRRRAVQFSISESWRGVIPSLLLMGRRRDKMGILMRRRLPF